MNILLLVILATFIYACDEDKNPKNTMTEILYTFPEESEPHEGTWLQWPNPQNDKLL